MKHLIIAGVLAASGIAPGASQAGEGNPEPSAKERLEKHPRYQFGCMVGRFGQLPPIIPQRFETVEEVDALSQELAGYTFCKARKGLLADATKEQIEAADNKGLDEFNRYGVIVSEAIQRSRKKAPQPALRR
ncbi:hypothetical protein [Bosea sp. BIWAKO-01]|uniref:hypothetical protein n=1 Tax=Bosea sp. BIWAKO-01 TaxID=506668 RepID=UPI000852C8A2|nr:hypothetical protein [Bosea sp. BIWAKO-01]GAU87038.1 hypothetical protein BIWAKO_06991 [Bosea sp. BIWAKO-01]